MSTYKYLSAINAVPYICARNYSLRVNSSLLVDFLNTDQGDCLRKLGLNHSYRIFKTKILLEIYVLSLFQHFINFSIPSTETYFQMKFIKKHSGFLLIYNHSSMLHGIDNSLHKSRYSFSITQ